jgi:hypothetical protein
MVIAQNVRVDLIGTKIQEIVKRLDVRREEVAKTAELVKLKTVQ